MTRSTNHKGYALTVRWRGCFGIRTTTADGVKLRWLVSKAPPAACDCGTGGSAAWRDVPQEHRAGIGNLRILGQVISIPADVRLRLAGVSWAPPVGEAP